MSDYMIRPRFVTAADSIYGPCPWGLNVPAPKNPDNAVRKMIFAGKFPFPVRKINGRNMVLVDDIDAFQAPEPEQATCLFAPLTEVSRRRRGRPRKRPRDGGNEP